MAVDRRGFLTSIGCSVFGPALGLSVAGIRNVGQSVPLRKLTAGPRRHWFGYYDKHQFSPDDRLILGNAVDFEGRSPAAEDRIEVGVVDTADADRWTPLGQSNAWSWQQACMLQFVPGGRSVIWNDREGDRFVSRIRNVDGGPVRTIDDAVYSLAPDGSFAVTTDFQRIQNMRPGYGYAGVRDRNEDVKAPADSGIRRVDLRTGRSELIFSYADAAAIPQPGGDLSQKWHYFNHLLVSPDGRRMIVLHRWRDRPARVKGRSIRGGFTTRMLTLNTDGTDVHLLDPSGHTSHFIWRDPQHVCAWSKYAGRQRFFLFKDRSDDVTPVGPDVMTRNGHNTYLNRDGADWILNDTYPVGDARVQTPYLFHVPTGVRTDLAALPSPPAYTGEFRCDLHPRGNRRGTAACVDSPHEGGRQMYLLDLTPVVG